MSTTKTLHRHRCYGCGCVWKHHPSRIVEGGHLAAHACPVCGAPQYWIYEGRQRAHRPEEVAAMRRERGAL